LLPIEVGVACRLDSDHGDEFGLRRHAQRLHTTLEVDGSGAKVDGGRQKRHTYLLGIDEAQVLRPLPSPEQQPGHSQTASWRKGGRTVGNQWNAAERSSASRSKTE
jgi:hypothetical protein